MISSALPIDETDAATDPVDEGGDAIERALRLGSDVVGRALVFVEAGGVADQGLTDRLPNGALARSEPVLDSEGGRIGAVHAIDFAHRAPLDHRQRRAMTDVAAVVSGVIESRRLIGETDHVTGLPNRRRFERDYARHRAAAGRDPTLVLVTLAEATLYNQILRAFGHKNAESFVNAGAGLVRRTIGPNRRIWHASVLSFVFMVPGAEAEAVARDLARTFSDPIMCGTLPIATKVGVGVAPLPEGVRASETLRAALVAAQDSRRGERGYARYDRLADEKELRSFQLLTDLDEALRDYGQLSLVYQPRIELSTGKVNGAEALVRWTHPTLGPISPAEFIPLAETTALMEQLTDFVMTRACRQVAAWRRDGLDIRVSVNVSPTSLYESNFLERADRIMGLAGIEPQNVEFEFTESAFTSTDAGPRAIIDGIRERGVLVAIDDFGMGYSNLDSITRLPADVLKIDRSLVQSIDSEPRRRKLCRAMIELGQDLDFHIVAEGVETRGVYDILTEWRCDEGQGYFMSRPLAANDFAAFAAAR